MSEPLPWLPRAVEVVIPPGERRNPLVAVRVAIGPMEVVLGVSSLKKRELIVRAPSGPIAGDGFTASPEVWKLIEHAAIAAVAAHPEARALVLGKVIALAERAEKKAKPAPPAM